MWPAINAVLLSYACTHRVVNLYDASRALIRWALSLFYLKGTKKN